MYNPDLPEAQTLKSWYASTGKDVTAHTLSSTGGGAGGAKNENRVFLSQIKVSIIIAILVILIDVLG